MDSRHRVRSNCSTGVESCAEAVATAAGGAAMFPRPVYPGSGVTLLASLSPAVAASLIGEMDPKKAKVCRGDVADAGGGWRLELSKKKGHVFPI